MKKITLSDLRAIPPYKVFGTGQTSLLRWVAQKLPNHDWTVYIGSHLNSDKKIIANGNTMSLLTASKLINCDNEVLERYWFKTAVDKHQEPEYFCPKHNIDYRICCDICQEKYSELGRDLKKTIKLNKYETELES